MTTFATISSVLLENDCFWATLGRSNDMQTLFRRISNMLSVTPALRSEILETQSVIVSAKQKRTAVEGRYQQPQSVITTCCSMLPPVAACFHPLQHAATRCSMLPHVATYATTRCDMLTHRGTQMLNRAVRIMFSFEESWAYYVSFLSVPDAMRRFAMTKALPSPADAAAAAAEAAVAAALCWERISASSSSEARF